MKRNIRIRESFASCCYSLLRQRKVREFILKYYSVQDLLVQRWQKNWPLDIGSAKSGAFLQSQLKKCLDSLNTRCAREMLADLGQESRLTRPKGDNVLPFSGLGFGDTIFTEILALSQSGFARKPRIPAS